MSVCRLVEKLAYPSRKTLVKLLTFMLAGLPSFAMAVPLNWLLVVKFGCAKPLAYFAVLAFQVTVNFFICWHFVFESRRDISVWRQFRLFAAGIIAFRVADWMLYSLLVSFFELYFLAVQAFNVILFAVLKFKFSQKVMEA